MKKDEPLPKLHDDPKISTAWKKSLMTTPLPQAFLYVVVELGLKPGRHYWRRRHRHHLSAAPPKLNPKNGITEPSRWQGRDPPWLHGLKTTGAGQIAGGRHGSPNRLLRLLEAKKKGLLEAKGYRNVQNRYYTLYHLTYSIFHPTKNIYLSIFHGYCRELSCYSRS
jgi:hypothetical protein